MTLSVLTLDDIPAPPDLYRLRQELGLSADGLAYEMGFAKNGKETVLDWERGARNGQPFKPTLMAWRLLRLMVVAHRSTDIDDLLSAQVYLRENLWGKSP